MLQALDPHLVEGQTGSAERDVSGMWDWSGSAQCSVLRGWTDVLCAVLSPGDGGMKATSPVPPTHSFEGASRRLESWRLRVGGGRRTPDP